MRARTIRSDAPEVAVVAACAERIQLRRHIYPHTFKVIINSLLCVLCASAVHPYRSRTVPAASAVEVVAEDAGVVDGGGLYR